MTLTFFSNLKRTQKGQSGTFAFALFVLALATSGITGTKQAHAAAGQHGAGFGLGQILLMGDFATNFSNSLGFNLFHSYEASALFGLLTNISMSNHSNADSTSTLSIKGITPNLRVNLAYIDKLVVYSFAGFGLFKVDETLGQQTGGVTTLGFNMGTAFNLALDDHFQFGTQISFHNIFGKTDPSTVTASSPGLSIGGTYIGLFLNLLYIF